MAATGSEEKPMITGKNARFALSLLLAAGIAACGGSTGNAASDVSESGGGGGGNGGLATAGAGGGAGTSASCPAGLGPPVSVALGGSGGDNDGGLPSLAPGVYCDNTMDGSGTDGGDLAGDVVCPVPSDPIWPSVSANRTTEVGISPRLPCPTSLTALNATFLWTSENPVCHTRGGTFANPTAGSTTFTCETAGDVTLLVSFGILNTTCRGIWTSVVACHL